MSKNKHIGSDFDDFLEEDGLLWEANAVATKRVLAFQIEKFRKRNKLTKQRLAIRLKTSRTELDRLLDPENTSVTLRTIARCASVLQKKVRLELVDA